MIRGMAVPAPPSLLLLAAGRSRRLGRAKGAAAPAGEPLVRRQLRVARAAGLRGGCVIVGAAAARVTRHLHGAGLPRAYTPSPAPHWREGLAGSLRDGLRALPRGWKAALILLVDQVAVSPADLRRLLRAAHRGGRWHLAAAQDPASGRLQAPVILPRSHAAAARALRGDAGLGGWLRALPAGQAVAVPMPAAVPDLDTPADAVLLRNAGALRGAATRREFRRCPA
jgi:molybdenum cofactor cytidylyltransferase